MGYFKQMDTGKRDESDPRQRSVRVAVPAVNDNDDPEIIMNERRSGWKSGKGARDE